MRWFSGEFFSDTDQLEPGSQYFTSIASSSISAPVIDSSDISGQTGQ